jgi:hypothetical protein
MGKVPAVRIVMCRVFRPTPSLASCLPMQVCSRVERLVIALWAGPLVVSVSGCTTYGIADQHLNTCLNV